MWEMSTYCVTNGLQKKRVPTDTLLQVVQLVGLKIHRRGHCKTFNLNSSPLSGFTLFPHSQ